MAWNYDATDLGTTTSTELRNSVRFLVGDTDTNDQQVQDEEILFALDQTNDNVYLAASFVCRTLASKFARFVDTEIDGAISENYSDLQKHYHNLSVQLKNDSKTYGGYPSIGVVGGGIKVSDMETAEAESDRPVPAFTSNAFEYEALRDRYEEEQ